MKHLSILIAFGLLLLSSCQGQQSEIRIDMENTYAWCIVPFDSLNRSPAERIEMLKDLGFSKYAYDWRSEHLPHMAEELKLAGENGLEVIAVWVWIDDQWDSLEKLNESNEKVFEAIEAAEFKGQVWVSFNANFFEGLSDQAAVKKGAAMIDLLGKRAEALGCKVGLYNHGDWFGEPENQIKIIKALPDRNLGIVFNFHHAHPQIDAFPEMVPAMMPYLWNVNLNGLRKGGPKILTIGQGDHEKQMIERLIKAGYKGDFGILGHVEEADVELILKANLEGLRTMF